MYFFDYMIVKLQNNQQFVFSGKMKNCKIKGGKK